METSIKPVGSISPKQVDDLYSKCLKNFGLRPASNPNELYIADPSQPIAGNLPKIVSEGQSWYQLISSRMAEINPAKAAEYQKDFDAILAGTEHMIALAKADGNRGEFSSWKVTIANGQVKLAPTNDGPANSAADADLDLIKSLIYGQGNVDRKIWTDKKYGEKALALIRHATNALFRSENGVLVLNPSEDWADFNFTDYMAPATCMEIAEFCEKKGEKDLAATWKQAAADSLKLYEAALRDTGEFPGQIDFIVSGSKAITARAHNNYRQTYDGIRSPWHIGEYAAGFSAQPDEMALAARAFEVGKSRDFRYTASQAMDEAMYLPLARAIGRTDDVQKMTADIFNQIPPDKKYFENSLVLIGLTTTYYPARNFSNSVPTVATPEPAVQPEKTQPVASAPKSADDSKVILTEIVEYFSKPGNHLDKDKLHVSSKEFEAARAKVSQEAATFITALLANKKAAYNLLKALQREGRKNDSEVSMRDLYAARRGTGYHNENISAKLKAFNDALAKAKQAPASVTSILTPAPKSVTVSGAAGEKKFELGAMDWDVNPGRIQSGQVSSSGNSVVLNNATTTDATGFKFNTAAAGNFQYLVVNIKEGAKGTFNWSGRVFKIEFDERPVNPENVSADEYYLWTNAEGKIYYKIPAGLRDIQIVLGRMTNGNVVLEFYLANEMEK